MKNLQLSLKTKWFEMTKNGIKTEDYRDITPYWCSRLLLFNGKPRSQKDYEEFLNKNSIDKLIGMIDIELLAFKDFDKNIMTLGYLKRTETNKILKINHEEIVIETGRIEWGAEPNKLYFVIKHGKIVSIPNSAHE